MRTASEDCRGGNLLRLAPHEADIAEAIESRRHAGSGTGYHNPGRRLDYQLTFAVAAADRDSDYGTGRDPNAYGRATTCSPSPTRRHPGSRRTSTTSWAARRR